jgi:hypothetical protein
LTGFVIAVGEPSQFGVHFEELSDEPLNSSSMVSFQLESIGGLLVAMYAL